MMIDKESAAHMIGRQRRYVQYLVSRPNIQPHGWAITFTASGTSVQNAVSHETCDEAGVVPSFVIGDNSTAGSQEVTVRTLSELVLGDSISNSDFARAMMEDHKTSEN